RGPAAAGLPARPRAHEAFRSLDRERLDAVQEAADVALRGGLPHALLDELRARAAENSLHEPLSARLILALAATGHRAEALTTYDTAARRLSDALGIDPGQDLREARRAALHGVPVATVAPRTAALPAPAQLPHDLPTFVGRRTELHHVLAASASDPRLAGTVVITAIGGMAGVGKTTLAVHLAHQVADRFPDGQLYVNLRGFDPSGTAVGPGEAVRGFLDALGVAPDRVPHGLDAQAALYRSLLAGRRFLVVLDNARDSEQVQPLLPASSGCLAIVTSRDRLAGLVAGHGARTLTLRPLGIEEAEELLVRRLGAERVAAEPGAVAEISALCAGLPL
ncbi:BTAD domain-containing putative transcriptional regulator, partial [Streptomyces bobili]|uniref:BTAD domain-containing putative transcriptional regulator n=1 Tax=Streptomyces bobili TaxID=67280 RepID=UPI0034408A9C